jgi:hypothetical protein
MENSPLDFRSASADTAGASSTRDYIRIAAIEVNHWHEVYDALLAFANAYAL